MIKMSKMHKRVIAAHGAMLALAAVPGGAALAQTAQATELQTVTVTAQRRTENIKEVPVSVTAIKGEKLDVLVSGGADIRLLAGKTPSLNVESSNGRTFPRFYIRGYGNTDFSTFASQPVSLIYDDIVQENPILKGYPIFDLAGVEVLRGPQGTLFGRNTPAGVVKFESEKPNLKKTEGYYNLSYGTHGTANVEGAINVPLSDKWAMRVSTLRQHRDDFVDNYSDVAKTNKTGELDGYNEHAERVQFLYKPDTTFSALFNVHQRTTNGSARLFRANLIKKGTNDIADGYDLDSIVTNAQNFQSLKTNGANARLTWDLGPVIFHSITGYESVGSYYSRGDIDGGTPQGPGFIPFQSETGGFIDDLKQYSQEFRVESKNTGPLNWQAGVYYFKEDVTGGSDGYNSATGARTSRQASEQNNKAWAAFGSVTYNINDALSVRGGIRYTDDKKDFRTVTAIGFTPVGPNSVGESKDKISWDLSSTYKLNRDVNLYARVATGFRAPSIAPASTFAPVGITVADAETITSYEGGIKADLFERRARAAFSLYDYEIKNQQLTVVGGNTNVTKLINAKKTAGRGAEFDLEGLVTPDLRVGASASYNFTEIRDPNLSLTKCAACTITDPLNAAGNVVINGNPLPQAPKWIVNLNARYSMPVADGEFYVYTDWSYRSKINFFLYEAKEFTGKPLTEGGLRLGYIWADGKYEVAAFGRNILDQRRISGAIDFNNLTGFTNEPRTYGVQFKGNF
ncbi:TonB-dependent receptor [Telluria mixta]|uniref:TonB-dependent receptor n=1 Tax=Telluria mixta TaxID=34071 RepID=A0ABT2C6I0_9BURK|nr:TonB-dependent receptor [Telluria mixta]MCS0616698.1 TonB-dependent receptor [Massilia kyonggiensis]MCS0632969.1 TonB-dependent receptor [Telluria mixta]WEM98038.1 TonB-dependent receptor [Telluria mixta]